MVVTFDSDSEQKPQRKHLSSGSAGKLENSKVRNRGASLSSRSFGRGDGSIGDGRKIQDDDAINFLMKYTDGKEKRVEKDREGERRRETPKEKRRERTGDVEMEREREREREREKEKEKEKEKHRDIDEETEKEEEAPKKARRCLSLKAQSNRILKSHEEDLLEGDDTKHSKTYDDWLEMKEKKEKKSAWKVKDEDMAAYRRMLSYYPPKEEETTSYSKSLYITAASLLAAGVTVAIVKNKFFT